jgi:predicted DNA-binding WGR domain protein
MELVKRAALHYQAGTSDKIYEVDLCQIAVDSYVVNFRYGRRGNNLKQGTKTEKPVSLAQAETIFSKLVGSKIKKGYRDISEIKSVTTPQIKEPLNKNNSDFEPENPRQRAILKHLQGEGTTKWSIERAIWRAGELKIKAATPLLINLIGTGDSLRDYCLAWALGYCGDYETIPYLYREWYENTSTPEFVKRIAWEAIWKLSDEANRENLRSQKIRELPSPLRELARDGNAIELAEALTTYLDNPPHSPVQEVYSRLQQVPYWQWRQNSQIQKEIKGKIRELLPQLRSLLAQENPRDYYQGYFQLSKALKEYLNQEESQHYTVLTTLYQIDNTYTRPPLLSLLKTAPLKSPYFQRFRQIFKIAEYRQDAEVFGIIAYRLDKQKPNGYDSNYGGYVYSRKTREYLRRRVWRTLKHLAEEEGSEYIKLATEILLHYSDDDADIAKEKTIYRWFVDKNSRNWNRLSYTRRWDSYVGYLILNHILHENSSRYVRRHNSQAWQYREGYKLGDTAPDTREEAFAHLWEEHPEALLRLLLESECFLVHNFAAKALPVCQEFCNNLDIDTIIQLINQPYEVTAKLGFAIAREKYNPDNPNLELLLALANCSLAAARSQAHKWLKEARNYFLEDTSFLVSLIISPYSDTRAFICQLLSTAILRDTTIKVLIGQIIAELLTFTPDKAIAQDINTLLLSFTNQLRTIGFGVILDLLAHPLGEIQAIGANILLNHQTPTEDLPSELIQSLLNSPHQAVRVIGIRIFSQLPDEKLLEDRELLVTLATHEIADIREAISPTIKRLVNQNVEFANSLINNLIAILVRKEKYEGLHIYLLDWLRTDLANNLDNLDRKTTLKLLRAKPAAAQELGGILLQNKRTQWETKFSTADIVKLANHEILAVRQVAWAMFSQNLERIKTKEKDKLAAIRLLEAKWDDSKEFALRFFSTHFSQADWTPAVAIAICDSVQDDVRQFGRNLVTRHFQASYGQEYLLKFSEHPSADMQLFATNYLTNYATDNPDRLRQLVPYFISVLSRINRGKVAKQRIFAFLEVEALKSEAAAAIVAEILTRQSLTIAIGDKAKAIAIMLQIKEKYPQISLPIKIKTVSEIRN